MAQLNELNELNRENQSGYNGKATRRKRSDGFSMIKISALCRLKMDSDIVEILFILPHINHALASHHRGGELLMGFLHSAQTDKLVFGIMLRQGIVECRDVATAYVRILVQIDIQQGEVVAARPEFQELRYFALDAVSVIGYEVVEGFTDFLPTPLHRFFLSSVISASALSTVTADSSSSNSAIAESVTGTMLP